MTGIEGVGRRDDTPAMFAWPDAHAPNPQIPLDELLHHSKNLFAIIQSLASLTARHATTIEDFKCRFTQRLHGLADAHELLMREGGHGAPLGSVIRRQLAPFVGDSPQVEIHGHEVDVGAKAAQTIGMAVHELATNAVRFGALSTRSGKVAISWRIDAATAGPPPLLLSWVEMGGPPVGPPSHRGFGHAVAVDMISRSLGARIGMDFEPSGVVWSATIPGSRFRN